MNAVDPKLRSFYSHSYAGLDVENDKLVVYRKPDAVSDTFVREQVDAVDVESSMRHASSSGSGTALSRSS